MSDRYQMLQDMRQSAKRLLRRNGPMPWSAIEHVLYCVYGHECEEERVMGPELDNDGVRVEDGKYVVVDD